MSHGQDRQGPFRGLRLTVPGSGLQHLTFGFEFNQSLVNVALPSSLRSLTFGFHFKQSLEDVALPSSLQSLTFVVMIRQPRPTLKSEVPSTLQEVIYERVCRRAYGQRGVCGIRFASVQSRREGAPPFLPGAPWPSPQGVSPLVGLPAKRLPGRWASAWRRRGSTYSNNQIAYSRPLTWIHRHRLGTS